MTESEHELSKRAGAGGLVVVGLLIATLIVVLVTNASLRTRLDEMQFPTAVPEVGEGVVRTEAPVDVVQGQTVSVPVYGSLSEADGRVLPLSCTLSLRNIDPDHPITVLRVDFHDTAGKLVREYLEEPLMLRAMVATRFVVPQVDKLAGTDASFVIEWVAEQLVHEPVVEAVMTGRSGTGVVSFVSRGHVLRERGGVRVNGGR